jgi:arginase
MRTIRFIEVPNELGAGTRGASLGIEAIKIAGLNADSNLFKKIPSVEITPLNHLLHEDIETPHAKHIEGLVQIFKKVNRRVKHELQVGRFPSYLQATIPPQLPRSQGSKPPVRANASALSG